MRSAGVRGGGLWVPGLRLGAFRILPACYSSLSLYHLCPGYFQLLPNLCLPVGVCLRNTKLFE